MCEEELIDGPCRKQRSVAFVKLLPNADILHMRVISIMAGWMVCGNLLAIIFATPKTPTCKNILKGSLTEKFVEPNCYQMVTATENVWNIGGNFIKENKEKFYENF